MGIKIYGYAIVNYMNLFARLSIYDANFVIQVIQLTGQQQQMPGDFLGDVIDKWLDKVREKKKSVFLSELKHIHMIHHFFSLITLARQELEN